MIESDWIQTYSGRKVYPLHLEPADVKLEDIAHHLSMTCRFSGAVREFYSVGQHSVLVSIYCEPEDALAGLLHDASEAYLLDLCSPLKHSEPFRFYRSAEARCMKAICEAFDLPTAMPASVHLADARILASEARDLMAPLHPDWRAMPEPYHRRVVSWSPQEAEQAFLARFRALTESPRRAALDALLYRGREAA